ncbi:MAG: ribbon-helix-helix protein, CopG family [Actinomycetota bacterium]|nr:ribbon-helix-helix protein, CopG family [Actinomycetota bacterium]
MPDLLIRDLSEADLQRLDARARALGLSRSEYVRRRLRQEAGSTRLTLEDLRCFAESHADLADTSVMAGAWR